MSAEQTLPLHIVGRICPRLHLGQVRAACLGDSENIGVPDQLAIFFMDWALSLQLTSFPTLLLLINKPHIRATLQAIAQDPEGPSQSLAILDGRYVQSGPELAFDLQQGIDAQPEREPITYLAIDLGALWRRAQRVAARHLTPSKPAAAPEG